jgi:hypothetical protein
MASICFTLLAAYEIVLPFVSADNTSAAIILTFSLSRLSISDLIIFGLSK